MQVNMLEYPLSDGYIHNWLVAGPHIQVLENLAELSEETKKQKIDKFFTNPVEFDQEPVEREILKIDQDEYRWSYYRCLEDHLVHNTGTTVAWSMMNFWAYTRIKLAEPVQAKLVINVNNPTQVWLNNALIYQSDTTTQMSGTTTLNVSLGTENTLSIKQAQLCAGESASYFSAQFQDFSIPGVAESATVQVPSQARFPHRFKLFEELLENAYVDHLVQARGNQINIRWNEETKDTNHVRYQIQDEQGRFYVEGSYPVDPKEPQFVGHPYRLYERPFYVALMPTSAEYWEHNIRYTRCLPVHVLDSHYSTKLYESAFNRRTEALENAARHEKSVFGNLARLALDRSDLLPETFLEEAASVESRQVGSEKVLIGLLMLSYLYADHESITPEIKAALEACALGFRYDPGDPGLDALDFSSESSGITFPACEILAGQLYADKVFSLSGKKGSWHRQRGEKSALSWLHQRGQSGFAEWNANSNWQDIFLALSQLTSRAKNEAVQELAAVLMDKMLFLMAVNSYKGAFGTTHGRTEAGMLKSAQLEATSGISRMLWGAGVFNHHIRGTIGLACSDYEFPSFFIDLANKSEGQMLNKEKHLLPNGEMVNLVSDKTPDYLLSSAQDFRKGQPGKNEHIWQATLGADAVVFTNHPANSSEANASQPGYWLGNGSLPRVVQWQDTLVAVYNLPEDELLQFTHAYFPVPDFDDFFFTDEWKFLQKGDGYLALTAAQGTAFLRQGANAYRELRSFGSKNVWVCQMGRKELDGSFSDFREKVLKLKVKWQPLGVHFRSLRGDEITFGWDTPLQVNSKEQPTGIEGHLDNPYCQAEMPASFMEIQYADYLLRLNFD